jgi:hypothetical protein
MKTIDEDLGRRLLFILHRGLVQTRNLALAAQNEQIADLADALEILPGLLDRGDENDLETVRFALRNFQDKYPGSAYDFLASLDHNAPLERF